MLKAENIPCYKIDDSDWNRYQSAVETVEESAVSWDDVSGILDIVMPLPLRLDKVSVYSCNIQQYCNRNAVYKVKCMTS